MQDKKKGTWRPADDSTSLFSEFQAPEVMFLTCLPAIDCFLSVFLL